MNQNASRLAFLRSVTASVMRTQISAALAVGLAITYLYRESSRQDWLTLGRVARLVSLRRPTAVILRATVRLIHAMSRHIGAVLATPAFIEWARTKSTWPTEAIRFSSMRAFWTSRRSYMPACIGRVPFCENPSR